MDQSLLQSAQRFVPRPYQRQAQDAVYRHWDTDPSVGAMLAMATGVGKTETALQIVADFLAAGERVVWLAHKVELLDQPMSRMSRWFPNVAPLCGVVQANRDASTSQCVFGSVDTLRKDKRMSALLVQGQPDLIVVDEAHHSTTPTYRKVLAALRGPETVMLALTATPERDDGADLSEVWEIVFSYSIVDGLAEGYLVPPYAVVDRLPNLDLSKVSGRRDYDEGELGRELLLQGIVEHTVKSMQETHLCERLPDREASRLICARERSAIVFTASVNQARQTAEALRGAGWKARYVYADTPKDDRRRLIAGLNDGQIAVLCNAAILNEGTDIPRCGVIVLARPTKSRPLFVQMLGRGLRPFDGKEDCMILDLAGATGVHSLISAPVLIGGSKCAKSPNGIHDFQPVDNDVRGQCSHCNAKVACFVALQESGKGQHLWSDDDPEARRCRHCNRKQCTSSSDGRHNWVPFEDFKQICMDCDLEISDPHAGMVGKKPSRDTAKAEWMTLPNLNPETWCVDVGKHGYLFVVGDREAAEWTPYWLKKGARIPRALSRGPIAADLVRTYANDLVRRARRFDWGSGKPPTFPQQQRASDLGIDLSRCRGTGEASKEISRAHARSRVIATGLAEEAG